MTTVKPLVNGNRLLQKFPEKGGWTYIPVPEIPVDPKAPFGWVIVKGRIDNHELKQYKLLPKGNGTLFVAVKAAIRKKIGKVAGDMVHLELYSDNSAVEIPEELLFCFENEPKKVYQSFLALTQGQQKTYVEHIYKAKTEQTKADRILAMMDELVLK